MKNDPRKYYDSIIGKTMKPVYWADGMPSFVPPHLHEQAKAEAIAYRFGAKPKLLEVLS